MKISVIVPVYNGEKTIENCLGSIYKTAYKDFEVIVVNDCSTDNTRALLKKFPCKVIDLDKNSGVSIARNAGAKRAEGELLYFVDADIVQKTDNLSLAPKVFSDYKDVDVINITHHWQPMNRGFGPEFVALRYYYDYDVLRRKGLSRVKCSFFQALGGFVPRKLFDEIGGFNENIRHPGGEEFQFGHDLNSRGYNVYTFTDLEAYHYWWSLIERIKANYKRVQVWLPLFFRRRAFEAKGGVATAKAAVNSFLLTGVVVLFFLSAFFNIIYIPISLLALYLLYNLDFYVYVFRKKKNLIYALLSIFADMALYLAAVTGAAVGAVKYAFAFKRDKK